MKTILFVLGCSVVVHALGADRSIPEIEAEIRALNNEYIQLQKNPIVIWGKKQEGKGQVQKRATSTYNINIAQGSDRKKYKTKKVISINPTYICPIHKYEYEDGHCPVGCIGYGSSYVVVHTTRRRNDRRRKSNHDLDHCRSERFYGTSNFCNLGPDYDLSYRTWKMLADMIPDGEVQESRLREIDAEIGKLKEEIKEIRCGGRK